MSAEEQITRQAVIHRHVAAVIETGRVTREGFADAVRQRYEAMVPERVRSIRFQDPEAAAVPSRAMNSNMKALFGYWDPERAVRMPVEIEEAVVLSLPDPQREHCIRELARRYGLYGSFRREPGQGGDLRCWGDLLSDFGQISTDMAAVLADGRLDAEDAAAIPGLIEDVERMQSDLDSLRRQAERAVAWAVPRGRS
jgi:hypothetical protein